MQHHGGDRSTRREQREPKMGDRLLGVLGLGALGQAVAGLAASTGSRVVAWSRGQSAGTNPRTLPAGIEVLDSATEVVQTARLVFFALPPWSVSEVLAQVGDVARGDHYWIHGCKGSTAEGELVHEVFRARSCVKQIGAIGGPVLASELNRRGPGGLVMASPFDCVLDALGACLSTKEQQLFRSHDIVGVQLAGAMRNVISVAAGLADGLGESARSAVLARGLIETARLGKALGAEPATFVGIAGVGDLIARRESSSSRNYQLGERCARGEVALAVLEDLGAVEGAVTARALSRRAEELGVKVPLATGVARVLDDLEPPREMIQALLGSDPGLGARDSLV
ncbi:MAG: NAD(P)H-dependent glycerol-3-phosphate dehydrogenase [Pseudomonadota bacterium]